MSRKVMGVSALALLLHSSWALAQEESPEVPTEAQEGAASRELIGEPTAPTAGIGMLRAVASRVSLLGYARLGYFWLTPSADDAIVGSRSGFRLANVRLGVSVKPADALEIVVSVEGSAGERTPADPLAGRRIVELRDAYLNWAPWRALHLRAGQFKAPYDAEALLGDGQLPFVRRSVVSNGVLPPEGFTQAGMTLDRQIGIEASSERLGSDTLAVRYALAVVNGNGPNTLSNDNNAVTPVGRVVLDVLKVLSVGVNGYYDLQTVGELPNRLTERRLGLGADLSVNLGGFHFLGVFLYRTTDNVTAALPSENALGAVGSLHYLHEDLGLEGGVRFAYFEPSTVQLQDQLTELALMVGYRPKAVPLRGILQYTRRMEEAGVSVGNDSVDVMVQVSF